MNYHWLKIKISNPVKFNCFWSYKNIFKQFEPKKLCKKNFPHWRKSRIRTQFFLLLSKSSEVCLYLRDNKVWHHSGTKNAWAYSVPTSIMQKFASKSLPFLAIQVWSFSYWQQVKPYLFIMQNLVYEVVVWRYEAALYKVILL